MIIYENCPKLENDSFIIRMFSQNDLDELLKVYSDKRVLPFINSDNCDGDNFYYDTKEKMKNALDFWKMAYDNRWFVRFSIVDKRINSVIGTAEICLRLSNDDFNNMGILRVDVTYENEDEEVLSSIFSLITPNISEYLGCEGVITKAPIYAIERIAALERVGYIKSDCLLKGKTGYLYNGYWKCE